MRIWGDAWFFQTPLCLSCHFKVLKVGGLSSRVCGGGGWRGRGGGYVCAFTALVVKQCLKPRHPAQRTQWWSSSELDIYLHVDKPSALEHILLKQGFPLSGTGAKKSDFNPDRGWRTARGQCQQAPCEETKLFSPVPSHIRNCFWPSTVSQLTMAACEETKLFSSVPFHIWNCF